MAVSERVVSLIVRRQFHATYQAAPPKQRLVRRQHRVSCQPPFAHETPARDKPDLANARRSQKSFLSSLNHPRSAQKSKKCPTEAIEEKLTKGGNLLDFQKLIQKKMEECGSDTIACLPDPSVDVSATTGTASVHSVVVHHLRFTMDKASEAAKAQSAKCDKCNQANDMDTKDLLCKSINTDIQDELDLVKEEKTTFIEQWMEVISIIRLPTVDKFEAIKKSIHTH